VSMKASTRQHQDITIVDLSGQIKLGEGSSVLRETVHTCCNQLHEDKGPAA